MKGLSILIMVVVVICLILAFVPRSHSASRTHWVCQDCDPFMEPHYGTITQAIASAEPDDTIIIVAEEFPPGGGKIVEYKEQITIDKPLTLECKKIHPVLGQPIIIIEDFQQSKSIIKVEKSAAGTVISNLHIRGPLSDSTSCPSDPIKHMSQKIGVRLETNECRIDNCKITHCMTGVFINTGSTGHSSGITISECIIGEPFVGVVNGSWVKEVAWTDNHKGYPIIHPGNGFGIVILEAPQISTKESDKIWYDILDCSIQSNRYNPVVLPPNHVSY